MKLFFLLLSLAVMLLNFTGCDKKAVNTLLKHDVYQLKLIVP